MSGCSPDKRHTRSIQQKDSARYRYLGIHDFGRINMGYFCHSSNHISVVFKILQASFPFLISAYMLL
jgi:hypothetical protein